MAELVLGPLLRHVGAADATLWVETDLPCEVAVLGRTARTFEVEGHHYALVILKELEPGAHVYEIALDGKVVWPERAASFPPSSIRLLEPETLRLAFGSCRVTAPAGGRHGADALRALAMQMAAGAPRHRVCARRRGGRLRGIHAALPRGLERARGAPGFSPTWRAPWCGTTMTCTTTGTSPAPGSSACAFSRTGPSGSPAR